MCFVESLNVPDCHPPRPVFPWRDVFPAELPFAGQFEATLCVHGAEPDRRGCRREG